jgi:hypothetical protein
MRRPVHVPITEVAPVQELHEQPQIGVPQSARDRCRSRPDCFELSSEKPMAAMASPSLESEARPGGGDLAEPALLAPDRRSLIVTSVPVFFA